MATLPQHGNVFPQDILNRVRDLEQVANAIGATVAGKPVAIATWSQPGKVQAAIGTIQAPVVGQWTVLEVLIRLGTAPVLAGCTVDVKNNGTSLFTTTPLPTVTVGNHIATGIPDITNLSDGDFLTVDVVAPDGADITVSVVAN